jgi:uracil-DNA glycosylase
MMNQKTELALSENWQTLLADELASEDFTKLCQTLSLEKKTHIIYPESSFIFNAFNKVSFDNIKIVILGQDPYHGHGQANGLSFSVSPGIKPPPSLNNIFKELQSDLGIKKPHSGCLSSWAEQGIFLLNSVLTVRKGMPNSHQNIGWSAFTDAVIEKISQQKKGVIFLLWGNFAQKKECLIDKSKHYILKAAHPSPFSAHRGFFGCKHFSIANEILHVQKIQEIDWAL